MTEEQKMEMVAFKINQVWNSGVQLYKKLKEICAENKLIIW